MHCETAKFRNRGSACAPIIRLYMASALLALLCGCASLELRWLYPWKRGAEPPGILEELRSRRSPLRWVSAHRGDRTAGSDNSLSAVSAAARAGVPLIEIDLRRNADGSLFLFHDHPLREGSYLGPKELADREPESLSDPELAAIKHPGEEAIASFEEALEAVEDERSVLQIDIKRNELSIAEQAIGVAAEKGMLDRLIVQCQRQDTLEALRRDYPRIALLARLHEPEHVELAAPLSPEVMQVSEEWLTPEISARIRAAGAKVLVKSMGVLDNPAGWENLIGRGADILMTDRPADLLGHFARRRRRSQSGEAGVANFFGASLSNPG